MRGLISLINGDHVDNYHKEVLAFVYYDLIVNTLRKHAYSNI